MPLPPMRPDTARQRASRRALTNVVIVIGVGAVTVAASFRITSEQLLLLLAVEIVGFIALFVVQFVEQRRDGRRVAVYLARVADPNDNPEIDPEIDQ